jgi:uncharacterized protein (DUF1778 family)
MGRVFLAIETDVVIFDNTRQWARNAVPRANMDASRTAREKSKAPVHLEVYGNNPYIIQQPRRCAMPREHAGSGRVELRLKPEDKAMLARAAALERLDLTSFILRAALPRAREIITESEKLRLSERDSLLVLDLLENPPEPSGRLLRAAKGGFVLE